jgi:hypothetical protein
MRWLNGWMEERCRNALVLVQLEDSKMRNRMGMQSKSSHDDVESDDGLNITIRHAVGGKIVTFRHFNHRTDRITNTLYVIPEELDFERELGKIITLESMRMS